MKVDDDARFDIERARFLDFNQLVNVVRTVCSGHELAVCNTLFEEGRNGNCSMAKDEANGQQPGRPPAEEAFGLRHCVFEIVFVSRDEIDTRFTKNTS